MAKASITWLSGPDIASLQLSDDDILNAVEAGLLAQGRGQTVIEPRTHLVPDPAFRGHFNILRGFVAPIGLAGVKIVGDYLDNYRLDLPSEMALLNLFDPKTGMPVAILDATAITEMRTGAMTALGAKHLARRDSGILGHVGSRGTSYWNVRLLDHLFDLREIRVHSRRPESREEFAARLERDLGKPVIVTEDWESCLAGADIMVEASRLEKREEIVRAGWIGAGALIIPYGTVSSLELSLTSVIDRIVVDDLGQFRAGSFGALRPHIDAGLIGEDDVDAELGEIVAGSRPGRTGPQDRILFWHRGLPTSDIALGATILEKARRAGVGQSLEYA